MTNPSLEPIDYMFLGPIYRTRSVDSRAQVDRLLGLEPGHRDSAKVVRAYCMAAPETRTEINRLLGVVTTADGTLQVRLRDNEES